MMRFFLFPFVLFVFCVSCKEASKTSTICLVEPQANLKSVLDSFVKTTRHSYSEYAVYINKTSPHEYELIIYAGSESLTKEEDRLNNQEAMQRVRVSDVEFDIYSGAEHYFKNKNLIDTAILKESLIVGNNLIWVVKDSFSVMNIYQVDGAYPFVALPAKISNDLEFKLPVEDSSGK